MREGSKAGVCGPLPASIQGLQGLVDLKSQETALSIHYNGQEFREHQVPLKVLLLGEGGGGGERRIPKPHKICI